MSSASEWASLSHQMLVSALGRIYLALARVVAEPDDEAVELPPLPKAETAALGIVQRRFGLSDFELDLLLLCAGIELEADIAGLCSRLQNDVRSVPTFSLALAALDNPHWDAIAPSAPLRRFRLIEVGPGDSLTASPLRIDERILHFLTGIDHLDERLVGLMTPVQRTHDLPPSQQTAAAQIVAAWRSAPAGEPLPAALLDGGDWSDRRAVAAQVCATMGLRLYRLAAVALPTDLTSIDTLLRLIEREVLLSDVAILVDGANLDTSDAMRISVLSHLMERISGPVLLSGVGPRLAGSRICMRADVQRPTGAEQRGMWQSALATHAIDDAPLVEQLVAQFNLDRPTILAAVTEAAALPNLPLREALWGSCRRAARPRLDDLAQRIDAGAKWDDLVLPEAQIQTLREVAAHVRRRTHVYERWQMGGAGGRGLGISALFAGASGTGKTTAAEAIAAELQLDLYRIDLSQVVSKYIGETEKNLRQVFDAAELGGAILLFDEADALFGKRSEVKESHDRYANIEVGYLLQRMEQYRGLAILTTNLRSSLDQAFLRRLRFIINFPFPDATQRETIWRRMFPPSLPTLNLDYARLARLNVAGGNIRNIALNAAFLAADAEEPLQMSHLLRAARSEYLKLERTLSDAEIAGWV